MYNPSARADAIPAQSAAYGQAPSYAASPPVPAAPSPKSPRPSKPRQTAQVPAQTATTWQSSLPVSPWSTYERQAGPVTGLETETVLRSDLRSLKRGRTRARLYLVTVVVLAAVGAHFGLKLLERNASRAQSLDQENRALKAQLSGGGEAAPAGRATGEEAGGAAPAAAAPGGSTKALTEELKRQLVGDTAVTVEARGDKAVVAMDDGTLFEGSRPEVNQAGYRVLYRFGKAIKNVQDRHIVVAVISNEGVQKRPWVVAASRAVSLGRFLIDDLAVEASRVSVMAPSPRTGARAGKSDRVEFWLQPASDN